MRRTTRQRFYLRNNLAVAIRSASQDLARAITAAKQLKELRKAKSLEVVKARVDELLDWAVNLPVTPEEKATAKRKR